MLAAAYTVKVRGRRPQVFLKFLSKKLQKVHRSSSLSNVSVLGRQINKKELRRRCIFVHFAKFPNEDFIPEPFGCWK